MEYPIAFYFYHKRHVTPLLPLAGSPLPSTPNPLEQTPTFRHGGITIRPAVIHHRWHNTTKTAPLAQQYWTTSQRNSTLLETKAPARQKEQKGQNQRQEREDHFQRQHVPNSIGKKTFNTHTHTNRRRHSYSCRAQETDRRHAHTHIPYCC